MDLNKILNKTKKKSEQIKAFRNPPSIASTDRPYSEEDFLKEKGISSDDLIHLKTDNKPTTNWQQTDSKTDNKPTTNWKQIESKNFSENETDNKPTTKLTTELATNRQQTDNKPITKTTFSILVGLQRSCLFFVYKSCKANRNKHSEQLSLKHIAQSLGTKPGTIKTTLQRLEEKKCLIRISFKNGRGGWSVYELPEHIFTEMLRFEIDNKPTTNWQQTDNKLATELATELATTGSSSSSSSYLNKRTTTSETLLLGEWHVVDIEPLKNIGFTTTHLAQIAQQRKLTSEILQDSIYAFAFDLKYNKKAASLKGSPLNYFMGIVRNGMPYAPPENYESPQNREMRIYLERKQKIENDRMAREEKLVLIIFNEWERGLNEEDKLAFLPEELRFSQFTAAKQAALRTYFKQKIWPQKCKELEKEIMNSKEADNF